MQTVCSCPNLTVTATITLYSVQAQRSRLGVTVDSWLYCEFTNDVIESEISFMQDMIVGRFKREQQSLPGRFTAAHCSLISKDGSNAEKNLPTGINKSVHFFLSFFFLWSPVYVATMSTYLYYLCVCVCVGGGVFFIFEGEGERKKLSCSENVLMLVLLGTNHAVWPHVHRADTKMTRNESRSLLLHLNTVYTQHMCWNRLHRSIFSQQLHKLFTNFCILDVLHFHIL